MAEQLRRLEQAPFARDAVIRAVDAEAVILVGGGRALLMQVAHPLVAQGVAEHSAYRRDRGGRLLRTLRPMFAIVFGTAEEVRAAVRGVNAVHRGVAGPGYRARDPELLLWVHATLVDTALECYRRFVRPLSPEDEARYYEETKLVGRLLGVPADLLPPSLEAFGAYRDGMVASLEVSATARGHRARAVPPGAAVRAADRALARAHSRAAAGAAARAVRDGVGSRAGRAARRGRGAQPAGLATPAGRRAEAAGAAAAALGAAALPATGSGLGEQGDGDVVGGAARDDLGDQVAGVVALRGGDDLGDAPVLDDAVEAVAAEQQDAARRQRERAEDVDLGLEFRADRAGDQVAV